MAAHSESRAGLVTTLVVFVVLTFVAGGLAVYYYLELDKSRIEVEAGQKRLAKQIERGESDTPAYYEIEKGAAAPRRSIYGVLLDQRNALTKEIAGSVMAPEKALDESRNAKALAAKMMSAAQLTVESDSLSGYLTSVAAHVPRLVEAVSKAQAETTAAQSQTKAKADEAEARIKTFEQEIANLRASETKVKSELSEYQKTKDEQVTRDAAEKTKQIAQLQEQINQIQVQLAAKINEYNESRKELAVTREKLRGKRQNVQVALTRQPDGVITRITGGETVWINLGSGDQVSPGMTFEVYDRVEGVPKSGEGATEEQLPQGKASIEVVNIGQNTSEARIIRKSNGITVAEGDIIANLIYDKNVKFNFLIYAGDGFDLTQTGRQSFGSVDVLKNLVRRWGGNVVELQRDPNRPDAPVRVPVETDFVILGKEPVVPKLGTTPEELDKMERAKKRLAEYDSVRGGAIDLHVPIMNQNRFLYFIGYFDLAKKQVP
jgi:hypothetical protein